MRMSDWSSDVCSSDLNTVGELVITQAMLAQQLSIQGVAQIPEVADLHHLTRELQDCAMSIRAQPIRSVFSRVPRIVRELQTATGKRVSLDVTGAGRELDKTVVVRIGEHHHGSAAWRQRV